MIKSLPVCPLASSTPSSETAAAGVSRRCSNTNNGVSAIDNTTIAVRLAVTCASMTPDAEAAANSTHANSPPCAISMPRSSACRWSLRISRATA
ncbi:hypothetical protein DXO170_08205 [Xanthomonas oryzae pv. oryzae]|uniref:Uncharacterized protein n=1 Tax=Xanthomonas oryzae pv. oryzae (strain KACC10331 / KXO85) TaxID=291331 RepID=Q05HZ0_XANOR|nr:hypothetical protein XOO4808 [Xanthomonas oryzae pv. oryzae KACC 10331]AOS15060.1 hypothetical protein ATY45_11715 [Xanthomonas oryzae pv. oryzae]OLG56602.1 hypothetical protein BXO407_18350 [Xanthomonas oryzae pv. oryzae]OLG72673.1 hypothetical protein BXO416_03065 [Xanthomonas oryzae pv. oryzae]OLG81279.1 hypothetical protein BXO571_12455 [Xanthomonas oryzae pv. oryzae]